MRQQALLVCLSFLVCCSRAGENPLPIEPLQPRSEFDLEASELLIRKDPWAPHDPQIKIGADVWIYTTICNVGLQPVHARDYAESLELNGKIVRPAQFFPHTTLGPLLPERCSLGSFSNPDVGRYGGWVFKPEEPGRYELKYRVHISPRLEEENKDNNELVVVVEVVW